MSDMTANDTRPNDITPEDGIVDGSLIPAYTNVWRMTRVVAGAAEEQIGVWHDRVDHEVHGGERRLVRKQASEHRFDNTRHTQLDEMELETLAPRRVQWVQDDATRV